MWRLQRPARSDADVEQLLRWREAGILPEWAFRAHINTYVWSLCAGSPVRLAVVALQVSTSGDRHLYYRPAEFARLAALCVGAREWAQPRLRQLLNLLRNADITRQIIDTLLSSQVGEDWSEGSSSS